MIKPIDPSTFPIAAEVIRAGFASVADEMGLTERSCPNYVGFLITAGHLRTHHERGWLLYGLYDHERLVGYVSLSKEADRVYGLHNLAVLPEYRHKGYGKKLLDFCVARVRELGANKVRISIVDENTVLKNWYLGYGFIHTSTKKFKHLPFISGYMELEVKEWD